MSETLKFGTDGQWATKVGSTLAFNDEGCNFKPLPFNFTRSTSATRVNKDGLIEVVTNNKPRIDFLNDSNGALLLEPSRTNLIPYSENLNGTGWNVFGASGGTCTRTLNYGISPQGIQNSTRVVFSGNNTALYFIVSIPVASTATIYVKGVAGEIIGFGFGDFAADGSDFTFNGEWQRLVFSGSSGGSVTINTWAASRNARDFEIYGVQLEAGSYATSYIPTQGATATRVAETCVQTPPSGIIGQTEGTIYADVNFVGVNESITNQIFFVREQGSNNGYLFAGFYQGKLNCGMRVGGSLLFDAFFSGVLTKGRYKIAVAYKSGDTKIYINGIQTGFKNNSFGVNNFAQIFLTGSAGTNQLGDINRNFKIYNTRLTDQELINLTTI